MLSENGETLLADFADQVVESADVLGAETISYILEASRALIINDEVELVRAFKALQSVFLEESNARYSASVVQEILPEPTPSMAKLTNLLSLFAAQGANGDPAKFIPLIRKLGMEPRIQRTASEIIARLSERALSRSLRAVFGLPPPQFPNGRSDVEDYARDASIRQ